VTDALPPPPVSNAPLSDERQMAMIVYLAYLASLAFPPLSIAGLVLAYVNRDSAPDWLRTHYTFQIHTFWIGLLFWFVSLVLCIVLIGFPLIFATLAWFVVRCALGVSRLMDRAPYPNPQGWLT